MEMNIKGFKRTCVLHHVPMYRISTRFFLASILGNPRLWMIESWMNLLTIHSRRMSLQPLISFHVLFQFGFHTIFNKNWSHESIIWIWTDLLLNILESIPEVLVCCMTLYESGACLSAYEVLVSFAGSWELSKCRVTTSTVVLVGWWWQFQCFARITRPFFMQL